MSSKKGHKSKKTKFSDDSTQDMAEKRAIKDRATSGVLSEKEALYEAPTAPTGTYQQEYYDANGNLVKFIGTYVPLYITPELLDWEFIEFVSAAGNSHFMAELQSRGRPITNDDKLVVLSSTLEGRTRLAEYGTPSNVFQRDSTIKPMAVKDYYIEANGVAGTKRGPRASVVTKIDPSLRIGALKGDGTVKPGK